MGCTALDSDVYQWRSKSSLKQTNDSCFVVVSSIYMIKTKFSVTWRLGGDDAWTLSERRRVKEEDDIKRDVGVVKFYDSVSVASNVCFLFMRTGDEKNRITKQLWASSREASWTFGGLKWNYLRRNWNLSKILFHGSGGVVALLKWFKFLMMFLCYLFTHLCEYPWACFNSHVMSD